MLSCTLVAILGFMVSGQNDSARKPEKFETDKAIIVTVLTDFIDYAE
ncbi:hypothetical protein [Dyadobacter bucti]|nr:hypothetical protein [Dyadobacter bucti]